MCSVFLSDFIPSAATILCELESHVSALPRETWLYFILTRANVFFKVLCMRIIFRLTMFRCTGETEDGSIAYCNFELWSLCVYHTAYRSLSLCCCVVSALCTQITSFVVSALSLSNNTIRCLLSLLSHITKLCKVHLDALRSLVLQESQHFRNRAFDNALRCATLH